MADDKGKHEHEHDETRTLDEAELAKDLEIKEGEDADNVKGGGIHVLGKHDPMTG